MDCDHQVSDTSTTASHSKARGRPSFNIKEEHLAFLARMSNTDDLYRLVKRTCPLVRVVRIVYCIHESLSTRAYVTRSLSYMTLPVHRKVPVAVDSYESTTRNDSLIGREMRTGECIFLVLLRTMRGMCRCQNSHFTEWIHGSTTTREYIRRPVRLVRVDNP